MSLNIDKILLNRELRVQRQTKLIRQFDKPIVSLTLNIPGIDKNIASAKIIYQKGINAILECCAESNWKIIHQLVIDQDTGLESILVIDADAVKIKHKMIAIENKSFGRVLDLDVIISNKTDTNDLDSLKIISRRDLKISARKCYLCNELAAICSRKQSHKLNDLLKKIEQISLQ